MSAKRLQDGKPRSKLVCELLAQPCTYQLGDHNERVADLLNVAGDKESFFRSLLARGGDSESVADFGLPPYACEGLLERGQGFGAGSLSRAASALQLA